MTGICKCGHGRERHAASKGPCGVCTGGNALGTEGCRKFRSRGSREPASTSEAPNAVDIADLIARFERSAHELAVGMRAFLLTNNLAVSLKVPAPIFRDSDLSIKAQSGEDGDREGTAMTRTTTGDK